MGYETTYKLKLKLPPDATRAEPCKHCNGTGKIERTIDADIRKVWVDNNYVSLREIIDGASSCKWYKHESDMRRVSLQFPGVLFTLHGQGENSGDVWVKYFLDGKMQHEQLPAALPPFDEAKLS